MKSDLKIAALQLDLVWENPEANKKMIEEYLLELQDGVDLLVLPEMFTTGFSMKPQELAEKMNGRTLAWMQSLARQKECAVTGSLIIEEEGQYLNRMIWMNPDGQSEMYDKRHLFGLAGEDEYYARGKERKIVAFKGWRFLLNVCYDLRFPVWSRNDDEYDCALFVANWPKPRVNAWTTLIRARAIENQSYVVGVNRVGVDDNGFTYSGQSAVIDMQGEELANAAESEGLFYATLNWNKLNNYRTNYPFYKDRDTFNLIY